MNAFVISSLLVDDRPEILKEQQYPAITILIAAYNEANDIATTLRSIFVQDYPGIVHIIAINDGVIHRAIRCSCHPFCNHAGALV